MAIRMSLARTVSRQLQPLPRVPSRRRLSAGASPISPPSLSPYNRTHLLFGANTDVGKSVVSAGLVRAAAAAAASQRIDAMHEMDKVKEVHYLKPLQCGGSDEGFVQRHRSDEPQNNDGWENVRCTTLFRWETPASPHLASRWEDRPVSDDEVLSAVQSTLYKIDVDSQRNEGGMHVTIIETAGGVLSPSSSSPLNNANHASNENFWGWSTQADLYAPLQLPVVFVGDGKLGGISVTLSSLEALWSRGYKVDAVVFIEGEEVGEDGGGDGIRYGEGNAEALREYRTMQGNGSDGAALDSESIICLPSLPPMPIPLDEWYARNHGVFLKLHDYLGRRWKDRCA